VTAIRAADTDGNPDTNADPTWTPFLVTPNHPSYISGHSGVSKGAATVLAAFFGTDGISFSLSSDSLPGVTRSYASFSAAAQEASDSRVYAGIHWRFDVVQGATIGNEVGNYIVTHFLLPVSQEGDSARTALGQDRNGTFFNSQSASTAVALQGAFLRLALQGGNLAVQPDLAVLDIGGTGLGHPLNPAGNGLAQSMVPSDLKNPLATNTAKLLTVVGAARESAFEFVWDPIATSLVTDY
jgi:hypothetical protein